MYYFFLILFYDLLFYLFFLVKSFNKKVGCCAVFVQVGVTTHLYEKEDYSWKFVFETKELADQWIKLLEFQKQSKEMKERDNRALNKAIF